MGGLKYSGFPTLACSLGTLEIQSHSSNIQSKVNDTCSPLDFDKALKASQPDQTLIKEAEY